MADYKPVYEIQLSFFLDYPLEIKSWGFFIHLFRSKLLLRYGSRDFCMGLRILTRITKKKKKRDPTMI